MTSGAHVDVEEHLGPEADTGYFVYGITHADTEVPGDLTGLDGAPVEARAAGRVAAVVTQVTVERPPGRGADLLAYNSVLDALAQQPRPVLPVRFGSILPQDDGAVSDFLEQEEDYFVELLDGLEGREQYLFQAVYDEAHILTEVVAAHPDIAELRERTKDLPEDVGLGDRVRLGELVSAAVDQQRAVDAGLLLDRVVPLVDAHVTRPVSGLEPVLDVALLVARERRGEFEHVLEALAEAVHPRVRLRLMGPTAPYEFGGDM